MEINIIAKREISERFVEYKIQLERKDFKLCGFILESVEGLVNHHQSKDAPDEMIIDVPKGLIEEFEAIINSLNVSW